MRIRITLLALFVICHLVQSDYGQQLPAPYFFDDFEDGDAGDGDPARWIPWSPGDGGSRTVVAGNYILTPPDQTLDLPGYDPEWTEADSKVDGVRVRDASIRTLIHAQQIGDDYWIGLAARDTAEGFTAAGTNVLAAINIDGTIAIAPQTTSGNQSGTLVEFRDVPTALRPASQDVHLHFDMFGNSLSLTAWADGEPKPDHPQVSMTVADEFVHEGEIGLWNFVPVANHDKPVEFRHFAVLPYPIGGDGRVANQAMVGSIVDLEVSAATGLQPGLLQRWYSIRNPGSYEAVLERAFDPLFPESSEEPDVPPFHALTTWWSGNRPSIPGLPSYPAEMADRPRTHSAGTWNLSNNDEYTVVLTGELLIPESGTYQFLDGIDDLAVLGIDLNRDGVVEEFDGELLINDNSWTNPTREDHDGGLPDDVIPSVEFENIPVGGEWFKIEAIVAEAGGGDSGLFYWDYDAAELDGDGVRLGDATGFPTSARGDGRVIATNDLPNLLVPDTHLRSEGGQRISSGTVEALLSSDSAYTFELGVNGTHDVLEVRRVSEVFTTNLDLNDATIQITALGELQPGEYDLLQADQVSGQATLFIPEQLQALLDTSRFLTEGILVVLGANLWDCNGDGLVEVQDANCATLESLDDILTAANLIKGDADGDGQVQFSDFVILSKAFGTAGQYTDGDFDKDGVVQFPDFAILAANFGQGPTAASVPEPSAVVILGLGALCLIPVNRGRHETRETAAHRYCNTH